MADRSLKLTYVVTAQDLASGKLAAVNKELDHAAPAAQKASGQMSKLDGWTQRVGGKFSVFRDRIMTTVPGMQRLSGWTDKASGKLRVFRGNVDTAIGTFRSKANAVITDFRTRASSVISRIRTTGGNVITTVRQSRVGQAVGTIKNGTVRVLGKIAGIATAVSILAPELEDVIRTWGDVNNRSTKEAIAVQKTANNWLKSQPRREDLVSGLAAVDKGINDITSNPLLTLVQGEALDRLRAMRADIAEQLRKQDANTAVGRQIISAVQAFNSGGIIGAINALVPHIDKSRLPLILPATSPTRPRNQNAPDVPPPSSSGTYRDDSGNVVGGGGRATGGPVWPGASFTVGERGRERLTLGKSGHGYVTPLGGRSQPPVVVYILNRQPHISAREDRKSVV